MAANRRSTATTCSRMSIDGPRARPDCSGAGDRPPGEPARRRLREVGGSAVKPGVRRSPRDRHRVDVIGLRLEFGDEVVAFEERPRRSCGAERVRLRASGVALMGAVPAHRARKRQELAVLGRNRTDRTCREASPAGWSARRRGDGPRCAGRCGQARSRGGRGDRFGGS